MLKPAKKYWKHILSQQLLFGPSIEDSTVEKLSQE